MFDFFEQPYTLVGAAVLVLFGVLTFRSVLPEKRRFWQWLLPVVLAGGAFALDALVQTDAEQISGTIETGAAAFEAEDLAALGQVISDDYSDSIHSTKERLLFYCRETLSQSLVVKARIKGLKLMNVSDANATVMVFAQITFDKNSYVAANYKPSLLIKARLNLKKRPGVGWLISRVELEGLDGQSVGWRQIR
ncbi:MAG: hypothetical protein AMJ65_08345 [Phycisphaerae bacterium SG8_4]|nr:MAG: hypothetical protein AMJ65_08345 [Phycisphaerae bacterium SG8_4]